LLISSDQQLLLCIVVDRPIMFDTPHHQWLELRAAQALAAGDVATAFRFADRRCRIAPPAEARSCVLRADALFRMGNRAAAIRDLSSALANAPDDIAANRRMLAWGDSAQQCLAAAVLIQRDHDFVVLRRAIEVLSTNGQCACARVTVYEDAIAGWAVWRTGGPLEIKMTGATETRIAVVEPNPYHTLASLGYAADFRLPRWPPPRSESIALRVGRQTVYSTRTPGGLSSTPGRAGGGSSRRSKIQEASTRYDHYDGLADDGLADRVTRAASTDLLSSSGLRGVTVVVPVYREYEATRACLESLRAALLGSSGHHAIVVNDATPDTRIAAYLAEIAASPGIELLTNTANLGFVGAVNRALQRIPQGDVILLNADTVVPLGFIDRLRAVAHSAPDIGTVTPLSNNGEFTSLPMPYKANPLGSAVEVEELDAIAARLHTGTVMDIPSGIGFCLYVTRACLDAVGSLSEDYYRGYLEDVDLCLRARQHGLRSVCAPSVYVGHAGSKSFGPEKRSLVVRNLDVLEGRFPNHRSECAAFVIADPLRPLRQAIELAAARPGRRPRWLVTSPGPILGVAHARARALATADEAVVILELRRHANGPLIAFTDPAGGMPQSIQFNALSAADRKALRAYAATVQPCRMEWLDPVRTPPAVVELLLALDIPFDLFIADAAFSARQDTSVGSVAAQCATIDAFHRNDDIRSPLPAADDALRRWHRVLDSAEQILVPDAQAAAFASSALPGDRRVRRIVMADEPCLTVRQQPLQPVRRLGLLSLLARAPEQRFLHEVACAFARSRPDLALTVIGSTLDDLELMRIGNVHVTGAVNEDGIDDVIKAYGLQCMFVSLTEPLFGHPLLAYARHSTPPLAYFDWSRRGVDAAPGDLPLDPCLPLDAVLAALARWTSGS
jgi:O-antigen biosynthesis protein